MREGGGERGGTKVDIKNHKSMNKHKKLLGFYPRSKVTTLQYTSLPLSQVPELSEQHVGDGAEVLILVRLAELHEEQLLVPHVRRPAHHQRFFLPRVKRSKDHQHVRFVRDVGETHGRCKTEEQESEELWCQSVGSTPFMSLIIIFKLV